MSQAPAGKGSITQRLMPLVLAVAVAFGWLLVAGQYPAGDGLGRLMTSLASTVLPALCLYVLPVGLAVWAWARLARRFIDPEMGLAVALALGLGVHLWLSWIAGWLGAMSVSTAVLLVAVPLIADNQTKGRWGAAVKKWEGRFDWSFVWMGLPAGLLLLAAAIPPGLMWAVEAFGYDVLSYHLQLPREWLMNGRLELLKHNVYSAFPSLGEAGYMHAFAWFNGDLGLAVFGCQFLHAATACLAAGVVAQMVSDGVERLNIGHLVSSSGDGGREDQEKKTGVDWVPQVVGAGVFLTMPWVLITGSLAYNEMFALVLGGAALAHAMKCGRVTWRDAVVVGVMAGAGTMAKLTAGPMLAVPAGVVLVAGLGFRVSGFGVRQESRESRVPAPGSKEGDGQGKKGLKKGVKAGEVGAEKESGGGPHPSPFPGGEGVERMLTLVVVMVLAGAVVLMPYFVRNASATGNPVFPFAAGVFGTGHWTAEQAAAFAKGHAPVGTVGERVEALGRYWVRNSGYGAFGGREMSELEKMRETRNVAVFQHEFGIPVFWLLALAGLVVVLATRELRWVGVALGATILWQAVFWVVGTHIQSRFMIFSLVPGCALVGLAVGRLGMTPMRGVVRPVGCVLIAFFALHAVQVFWSQTYRSRNEETGKLESFPACVLVGNLGHGHGMLGSMDESPMNHLPAGSKVMWVADASRLLYSRTPMSYHSAFDSEPLGDLIRAHPGDTGAVTRGLKGMGITHVWVHWSELARLHATYGYDKDVTPQTLMPLVQTWTLVPEASSPYAALYVLP
jgi:hypothetical protein